MARKTKQQQLDEILATEESQKRLKNIGKAFNMAGQALEKYLSDLGFGGYYGVVTINDKGKLEVALGKKGKKTRSSKAQEMVDQK